MAVMCKDTETQNFSYIIFLKKRNNQLYPTDDLLDAAICK